MNARGFTLVEVLVALAIVAITLLASTRAMGVMAGSGVELRHRLLADLSARNRLAWLHATRSFPAAGVTSEPCPQGTLALVCRQEVKTTPNAAFRRVEVRVHLEGAPEFVLGELAGLLPLEPVR